MAPLRKHEENRLKTDSTIKNMNKRMTFLFDIALESM